MNYLTGAGPAANPVAALTWGLLVISIVVVLIVTVLVLAGVLRRRTAFTALDIGKAPVSREGGGLRWIWIGVGLSSVALLGALFWTVATLAAVNQPREAAALTVRVTGEQWWWKAVYSPGDPARTFATANEIHIPVGRPVRIELAAADVIHSFWIPQLAGKTDAIPGRTNVMWLQADRPGRYLGQCAEYCGLQHTNMAVQVIAQTPADFEAWRAGQLQPAAAPPSPDLQAGQTTFVEKCGACHTVRGSEAGGAAAPDLTHLMTRSTLAAGALPNTSGDLAGWIADPQGMKPGTNMPTLRLSGEELAAVTNYLETLK